MPRQGFADNVRRFIIDRVEEARANGDSTIDFQVGAIREALGTGDRNDVLDICQVLETQKAWEMAGIEVLEPGQGRRLDSTYRFRIMG